MIKKSTFEVRHPMFRPLWIRALITLAVLGWTGVELVGGNFLWAAVFGAAGAYLVYAWFIIFDPAEYETPKPSEPGRGRE